jgi:hypothetical protein
MTTPEIAALLAARAYHWQNEKELQRGIGMVLTEAGVVFVPEVSITRKDRIDFLVGKIGIEIKVGGSLAAVTRQLFRYAECPEIDSLVLVTTKQAHRNMPNEILGKPLHVVWLSFL